MKNKIVKNKKDKKTYFLIFISFILGIVISIASSYAIAETLINSKDVSYVDNSKLGATNVQAAIDGTCTKFSNDLATLLDKMYPIGSIYISTTLSTPAQVGSAIGGTWESYGKGQTLVGIDTSQTEFSTVGKTGGNKSNSYTPSGSIGSTGLTISQIPSHTHTYDKANSTTGSHTLTIAEIPSHSHFFRIGVNGAGNFFVDNPGTNLFDAFPTKTSNSYSALEGNTYAVGGDGGHTHTISTTSTSTGTAGKGTTSDGHTHTFTGTATTLNNLQPYITVYMYKRTK